MERYPNPGVIRATAAELAVSSTKFESHEIVINTTTGEVRQGPGTWPNCRPINNALPKLYVAKVVQDGTDAGVPTVLYNSLGDDVVFTYGSNKNTLTLADAFPADKVVVTVMPDRVGGLLVIDETEHVDDDSLTIGFIGSDSGSPVNGTDFTVKIEVYP